jgi:uncharacterized protein (DUF305 family)
MTLHVYVASAHLSVASAFRRKLAYLLLAVFSASLTAQTPSTGAALYSQEDLLFLSHMIVHHEQALELAALVPTRTTREELKAFARLVDRGQRVEIDQMKSLLALAADRGTAVPEHALHTAESMPGLLSKTRMAAIAAANGTRFERLWLEGMIEHHEGALTMGREQQRRQFESKRQPFGIDVLVDDILVVQRGEITKMNAWLTAWGLSKSGAPGMGTPPR